MSGIQAKQVAGYVVMPGIMPRVKNLFTSGFGYVAFLIAQIYAMVRLLPPNHTYLDPKNIGQFGVRQVVAQAAHHLVLKKENVDQMVIFTLILVGLVLIVIQIAMIVFMLIFEPALASYPTAAHPTGASIFVTPGPAAATGPPTFDIAFMLLDQVFGIPDLYESCIEQAVSCQTASGTLAPTPIGTFPWPFHNALHELFRFYNTGILLVGALIFLYFILIVIGETAVTGTPFGQRFQNVWVPIRLVVAVGLLIPIHYGLNSGQFITLFAAKFGSSLATNTWITYNNTIRLGAPFAGGSGANPTGERESLIGNPEMPDVSPIIESLSIVHACAASYWYIDTVDRSNYIPDFYRIQPYFYKVAPDWMPNTDNIMPLAAGTSYADALTFFNNSDIIIRFGVNGDDGSGGGTPNNGELDTQEEVDKEEPLCGEIKIAVQSVTGTGLGADAVQEEYFNIIRDNWFDPLPLEFDAFGYRFASLELHEEDPENFHSCDSPGGAGTNPRETAAGITRTPRDRCFDKPTSTWQIVQTSKLMANLKPDLLTIWNNYTAATNLYEMDSEILSRGWAGAGIWYNTIARVNGNYMSAVRTIPTMTKYPTIMEVIAKAEAKENVKITQSNRYCHETRNENVTGDYIKVAEVLCNVTKYWNDDGKNLLRDEVVITGSVFEDTMNLIFGTQPLSAMNDENVSTHPLTQLAMLGRGLVDASIRNIATASAGSALGGLGVLLDRVIPGLVTPAADFILSTAFVGLTAGLVLYYIVPFLPFIYFFFAVSSWVKSIFEAMVGVPLWALAHLRIDGEGLPGTSALNGYFLIFEIFLRPILTIFGLVAATVIFTAQVRVLHFLWELVTQNLSGFENDSNISFAVFDSSGKAGKGRLAFKRSIIDQFFFNIIYAIIVYMMAIAAFKLIDKIPDNILRWMGNQVSAFGDINQDSVDGLTRYAALGGATAGRGIAEGVQQAAAGSGGQMGTLLARVTGAR